MQSKIQHKKRILPFAAAPTEATISTEFVAWSQKKTKLAKKHFEIDLILRASHMNSVVDSGTDCVAIIIII